MMPTSRQQLGSQGEALAAAYLQENGYLIVEQNWRCPVGEIDIVAQEGGEWAFVEVRTRRAPDTNAAIESITGGKEARMIAAAEAYITAHGLEEAFWRIDLTVVALTPGGPQIEVIRNAVGW